MVSDFEQRIGPQQGPEQGLLLGARDKDTHVLNLRVLSTWGSLDKAGLTEIDVFDEKGQQIKLTKHLFQVNNQKPGTLSHIENIIDGVTQTSDEKHMWYAIMPDLPQSLEILITCQSQHGVGAVKVWNYNRNLLDTIIGVRHVQLLLDGQTVWEGVIKRGSGNEGGNVCTLIKIRPDIPLREDAPADVSVGHSSAQELPHAKRQSEHPPDSDPGNTHKSSLAEKSPVWLNSFYLSKDSEQAEAHQAKMPQSNKSTRHQIIQKEFQSYQKNLPSQPYQERSRHKQDFINDAASQKSESQYRKMSSNCQDTQSVRGKTSTNSEQPQSQAPTTAQSEMRESTINSNKSTLKKSRNHPKTLFKFESTKELMNVSHQSKQDFAKRPQPGEAAGQPKPQTDILTQLVGAGGSNARNPFSSGGGALEEQASQENYQNLLNTLRYFELNNEGRLKPPDRQKYLNDPTGTKNVFSHLQLKNAPEQSREYDILNIYFDPNAGDRQALPKQATTAKPAPASNKASSPAEYFSKLSQEAEAITLDSIQENESQVIDLPRGGSTQPRDTDSAGGSGQGGSPSSSTQYSGAGTNLPGVAGKQQTVRDVFALDKKQHLDRVIELKKRAADSSATGAKAEKDKGPVKALQIFQIEDKIPVSPVGQHLTITIFSTWGDIHFFGLNGIEIFDESGPVKIQDPFKQVAADPSDINILPQFGNDVRICQHIVDGTYVTQNPQHLWLAPFFPGREHYIYIDLLEKKRICMIRVWNYNKSRIHSFRGVKDIQI